MLYRATHLTEQHKPTRSGGWVKCCPLRQDIFTGSQCAILNQAISAKQDHRNGRLRDHLTHPPPQLTVIMFCRRMFYAFSLICGDDQVEEHAPEERMWPRPEQERSPRAGWAPVSAFLFILLSFALEHSKLSYDAIGIHRTA